MSPTANLTILLVDDNQNMRAILRQVFRGVGFRAIHEASDGAEALDILRSVPIDLVIVDQKMGMVDGIEMVRMVRRAPDSGNPFVPILMLTAHTERSAVIRARDAGVNGFLAKPISARGVLSRIELLANDTQPFIRCASYVGPCRRRRADPHYPGPERRENAAVQRI